MLYDNYKLHTLRRTIRYLSLEKAKLLCNAFINRANLNMLHWCECFAEKKIFKDSIDSPQSTEGGI